jgi:hypothetical protein
MALAFDRPERIVLRTIGYYVTRKRGYGLFVSTNCLFHSTVLPPTTGKVSRLWSFYASKMIL